VYFSAKLVYSYALTPLYNFYRFFLRRQHNHLKRYGGGWVVITGASSGIGLGYSKVFASLGFNVFMISINQEELEEAAKEVK
jgi:NADPH:quinone reductase-like Zn-dependent oxidoreductase